MNAFYSPSKTANFYSACKKFALFITCCFIMQFAVAQQPGNALQFNGTNQYVTLNINRGGNAIAYEYTVEAWVKPVATTGVMEIVSTRSSGAGGDFSFDMKLQNGNSLHGDIGDGTQWITTAADATLNYKAGQWYHIAYTASLSHREYRIYVNGALLATGALNTGIGVFLFDASHTTGYIGTNGLSQSEYFNGSIDEVKFYGGILSQADIQADMVGTSITASPRDYYNFNQSSGTTLNDIPANGANGGANGTLVNAPTWVESYAMVVPTATAITNRVATSFTANWTAPANGTVTNYLFDLATSPDFADASMVSGYTAKSVTGTSLDISGLSNSITYYYRVRAFKNTQAGTGINSATITVPPAPVITSFTPIFSAQNRPVDIYGSGFTGATWISFGGTVAGSWQILSDTHIQAYLAAGSSGTVSVTTPAGIATKDGFIFVPGPVIFDGPTLASAGAAVSISGTNFDYTTPSNNTVYFGKAKAVISSVPNNTIINTVVPKGATYGPVSVTTAGRTASVPNPFNLTFSGGDSVLNANSFASTVTVASATVNYVTLADFDGDGKLDMLTENKTNGSNTFSVYRNITTTPGTPVYDTKVDLSFSNEQSTVVADFDGDGKLDIAVANNFSFTIFKNTGSSGSIAFTRVYTSASIDNSVYTIAAGDTDQDGLTDIVLGNIPDDKVTVYRNTTSSGTISFAAGADFAISGGSVPSPFPNIAIADIDRDGRPDIAALNYGANTVSVLRNTSYPTVLSFDAKVDFATRVNPVYITVADINEDSKPEMIIGYTGGDSKYFSIFNNTSSASGIAFDARADSIPSGVAGAGITGFTAGDLNGDGKPDFAVFTVGSAYIYTNTNSTPGVGSYAKNAYAFVVGRPNGNAAIGDADGDGKPDITFAILNGSGMAVMINTADKPNITSFTPASAGSDSVVTITGTNFTGATAVSFGGTAAKYFLVVNKNTITAEVAAGASGAITVTNAGGTAQSAASFTYLPSPVITDVSPSVAIRPGTTVTITGTNFTNVTAVTIGGVAPVSYTVVSATSITAIPAAAGTVLVKTKGGTGTFGNVTFAGVPVISSFSPLSAIQGATVTITGTNFSSTTAGNIVYFGAVQATVSAASATSLTVTVPSGASYSQITVTANGSTAYSSKLFNPVFTGGDTTLTNNSFASPVTFAIGNEADYTLQADLNGDGKPDMIFGQNSTLSTGFSVLPNSSTPGNISYGGRIDYNNSTNRPFGAATADFDGDGKLDVAVFGSNTFTVYQNTSSGGTIALTAGSAVSTTNGNASIAVADMDGDGRPDIVLRRTGSIDIYRNISSGGTIAFASAVTFTIGGNTPSTSYISLFLTDLDGDGKPDMLATNFTSDVIGVFKNNSVPGGLSFGTVQNYSSNAGLGFCIGDFNGDGNPDLAVSNNNASVSILLNTSSANTISFGNKTDIATPVVATQITAGDLNGDGKSDIIGTGTRFASMYVLLNTSANGTTAFATKSYLSSGSNSFGGSIGDIDGDGKADIAVANSPNNSDYSVLVLRNNTTTPNITSFTPTTAGTDSLITITGSNLNTVTAVSIGGTAAKSFTLVNSSTITATVGIGASGSVSVTGPGGTATLAGFIYKPAPNITAVTPAISTGRSITITGTDFTQVTSLTIGGVAPISYNVVSATSITAVVGNATSGVIIMRALGGVDTFSNVLFAPIPSITSFSPASAVAGATVTITGTNFNTTADSNIVYFGGAMAPVSAASATSLTVTVPAGATYSPISVTSRGVTAYSINPFTLTITAPLQSLNVKSFAPAVNFNAQSQAEAITMADLDGDGKLDVIESNTNNNFLFTVRRNISTVNSIQYDATIKFNTSDYSRQIAADIDGDGKLDVVAIERGKLKVWLNAGTPGNIILNNAFSTSTATVYAVAVADIDGDGLPDIITQSAGFITVYRNTSSASSISFGAGVNFGIGANTDKGIFKAAMAITDVDGDGKPDVIAVNTAGNTISVLRNTSSPTAFSFAANAEFATGVNPVGVYAGDFNNDGKLDVAVCYYNSTIFSVLQNTTSGNNISFSSATDFTSARPGATIAAGDINGDGKIDIVISGSNTNVFLNTGTGGNLAFVQTIYTVNSYYGSDAEDGVAIGDIDGDGKPDIATESRIGAGSTYNLSVIKNQTNTPHIGSFTPTTDVPDSLVTISGFGFTGASAVSFGGTQAASYQVVDDNTITAKVGSGATGTVYVTNQAGIDSLAGFTFLPTPVITSVTPSTASIGTVITIKGITFSAATGVTIAGNAAPFTIQSDSVITATVGGSVSGDLTVNTPYGNPVYTGFIVSAPVITSVTPSSATVGSTITIKGSAFTGTTSVTFGGNAATFTFVSDSVITVILGKTSNGTIAVTTPAGTGTSATGMFTLATLTPPGNALNFNGSTNYVRLNTNPLKATFTIEFWMKANQLGATGTQWHEGAGLVDAEVGGLVNDFGTSLLGNKICFGLGNPDAGVDVSITSTTSIDTGRWVHVAAVRQKATGKLKLYINGVLDATGTAGTANTSSPTSITIGAINTLAHYFNGSIDEVRLFTTDRSDSIAEDMKDTVNAATTGLAAYYNFDEGVAGSDNTGITSLIDLTANNRTATLTNFNLSAASKYNWVESYAMAVPLMQAPTSENTTGFTANWTAPLVGTVDNYIVSIATDSLFSSIVQTNTVTGTSTSISNLIPGTNYWYRVRANKASVTGQGGYAYGKDTTVGIPVITSFTPNVAFTDTVVTIKGHFFTNVSAVSFGGTVAKSFAFVDSTTITAVVGAGTSGDVSVTTPGGTATKAGFIFTPAPAVTSFVPASATIDSTVSIHGLNFSAATGVTLGGIPAASFTIVSNTLITAVVANSALTNNIVSVTSPTGTGTLAGFTLVAPAITSFTPSSASIGGTVTINGSGFTGTSTVNIGGNDVAFTVVSDNVISAIIANGAVTTNLVSVTSVAGTGTAAGFTLAAPAITSFTPSSAGIGTAVTINGSGFTGTTAVSIGGSPAMSFTVVNDGVIKALVGNAVTNNTITVTSSAGTGTATGFNLVVQPPPGNALNLANNGYVTVPTGSVSVSNSYTVEAWIKPANTTSPMNVFSTRAGGDYTFGMAIVNGTTLHADIGDGNNWATTAANVSFAYTAGVWYHVAYVVTPTGYTTYINGKVVGGGNFGFTNVLLFDPTSGSHNTINIGYYPGENFTGSIDEVKVWTNARTAQQVQADMLGVVSNPAANAFLAAYYNFDEGAPGGDNTGANVLYDQSANHLDGTLGNELNLTGDAGNWVESYVMVVPVPKPATNFTSAGFTANWDAPAIGVAEKYMVQVATDSNFTSVIKTDEVTGMSDEITGLTQLKQYWFRVKAEKASVTGQGLYSGAVAATTAATPAITSFSPVFGVANSLITIKGVNLINATGVSFGGTATASFTVIDSTTITAIVGAGSTGKVSVTIAGENSADKNGFIFNTPMAPPGNALGFDSHNRVSVPTGNTEVKDNFTVEGWVMPLLPTITAPVLSTRVNAEYGFDFKFTNGNTIHGDIGDGSQFLTLNADATFKYEAKRWYHVAYSISPDGYTIYVNGQQVGSGSFAAGSHPMLIDATHNLISLGYQSASETMFGQLDEVKIWTTTRSAEQVKADMFDVIAAPQTETGLLAYYNFDEGDADGNNADITTLIDGSANNLAGTLNGFSLTGRNGSNWTASYAMIAPTAKPASGITTTGFTANWDASVLGTGLSYQIDVSANANFSNIVATVFSNGVSQNVTGLSAGTTYWYRVFARRGSDNTNGAYLPVIQVTTSYLPSITSFNPSAVTTGTVVTITGHNFTGITGVSFGGVPAASYTVNDSTSITAIVAGGQTGFVTVSTAAGAGTSSSQITFSLPTATLQASSTQFCQGTSPAGITFFGDGGTVPYTFTYTINNGPEQTITTEGFGPGISVIVPTTPGTYVYSLLKVQDTYGFTTNVTGTATVVTKAATTHTTTANVCFYNLPYHWNGGQYSSEGTYEYHMTNAEGCDSTDLLVLNVLQPAVNNINVTVCASALPYHWNGNDYFSEGTYTFTTAGSAGCDSSAVLHLSVTQPVTGTTNVEVCPSGLPYRWNGTDYNSVGTFTFNTTSVGGCDSIATLVLSIKPAVTSTTTINICPSQLPYHWNNHQYSAAGTYTYSTSTAAGCDSIATLVLTVGSFTSTTDVTIDSTAIPYVWNGTPYSVSGTYTFTTTAVSGCDSVATLHLTITNSLAFKSFEYTSPNVFIKGVAITPLVPQIDSLGAALPFGPDFIQPSAITTDSAGNIYVADIGNGDVTKLDTAGNVIGLPVSGFTNPFGLATDAAGNVYVADEGDPGNDIPGNVKKISGGSVTSIGSGFVSPVGIAADAAGNVYVTDFASPDIKKVAPDNTVSSFWTNTTTQNGGLAIDADSNVYVADFSGNVTKISQTGVVTPIATIPGTALYGIVLSNDGSILVSDINNAGVYKIAKNGSVTKISDLASFGLTQDKNGNVYSSLFGTPFLLKQSPLALPAGHYSITPPLPQGLAINNTTGIISGTPAAGSPRTTYTITAAAGQTAALDITVTTSGLQPSGFWYQSPQVYTKGIAIGHLAPHIDTAGTTKPFGADLGQAVATATDASGNVYVTDAENGNVVKMDNKGNTIATLGHGLVAPYGITVDASGYIYIADAGTLAFGGTVPGDIKKISPDGNTITTLGSGFIFPVGVAVDGTGNVYVTDVASPDIKKIAPDNSVSTLYTTTANQTGSIAIDGNNNILLSNFNSTITRVTPGGVATVFDSIPGAQLFGMVVNTDGSLFVGDVNSGTIYKMKPGVAAAPHGINIPQLFGLAGDHNGNLYVTSSGLPFILKIEGAPVPATAYSISPALPAGLIINHATGVISGTPLTGRPLTTYTVTGSNTDGSTTAALDITVNGPLTTFVTVCVANLPYHWNGNDYNTAGNYTVHLTGTGGADSIATLGLTIASPTAAIRANQQITTACYGLTRNIIATPAGGTAPYQYSLDGTTWQDSARFAAPAGTYHIMVKDDSGCVAVTPGITLTQPAEKLVITSAIVNNADITVTVAGGYGGYTYSLDGGAYSTSNTLTGVSAGIDTVRVHDQGGCVAAARVNILTATIIYDGGNNMVCYNRNKAITIIAAGGVRPYRYTFDGNTAGRIMLAAPGTHTITVQDAAGNSYSTGITITAPAEKLNLTLAHSNATCAGGDGSITALPSGGYAGYTYSINSGSYAGENVFNNLDAGTYTVSVMDAAGCTSPVRTAIVKVPVNPCPGLRSGDEPTSSKGEMAGALVVKVMPNPAVVEFTLQVVSGDSKKVVEIRVMDMLGRTVYHTRGSVFDSYRFGRNFAGGMYIAEVLNGDRVQRVKLVKGN